MRYDLSKLGWYNFEQLTQAILKDIIGPGVQAYGGTVDQGRDAVYIGSSRSFPAYEETWSGSWVFQAKFCDIGKLGSKQARVQLYASLLREISNITKKQRIRINNYIILTNVELTGTWRDRINATAQSLLPSQAKFAIIDGIDICNLLDLHPQLRRSFPQLLGLADLDHIIHRELYARSEAFLSAWQPRLRTFVLTDPFKKALHVLAKNHFVVLDGAPEAGKSTIAASIALSYAVDGFAVVDLRRPGDFYNVYDKTQRQLFVADDAIGSNDFDPGLGEAWTRDLPGILSYLSSSHKLVWTTRSYILKAALARTRLGEVKDGFPSHEEVLVTVDQYTELERANMLYNHAKANNLPPEQRKALSQIGLELIKSPNLTPERIRQLCENVLPELTGKSNDVLVEEIRNHFRNPSHRWITAFHAIGESEQHLLLALLDRGPSAEIKALRSQYETQLKDVPSALGFNECIDRIQHGFIRVSKRWDGETIVDFQHPSLRDILLHALANIPSAKVRFIEHLSADGLFRILNNMFQEERAMGFHLTSATDLDAFLARIQRLRYAPLTSDEWKRLLRVTKSRISMLENIPASDVKRKIIEVVLLTACSSDTYFTNRLWPDGEWLEFTSMLYELLPLSENINRPEYVRELSERILASADFAVGIRFWNLLRQYEPIIAMRKRWTSQIHEWVKDMEEEVASWVETAPETVDEDEHDEWRSRLDILDRLLEIVPPEVLNENSSVVPYYREALDTMVDNMKVISEEDEPDYDYDDFEDRRTHDGYWTVERLIRDIAS